MSAVRMTPAENLLAERRNEFKSEYRDGYMIAMPPFSAAHCDITTNLIPLILAHLTGTPWRWTGSGMRIKVPATGLYTYPDGLVYFGELDLEDAEQDTALNPCVLVEVMSDTSSAYDRVVKFRHSQRLPSLEEYVLIDQYEPFIERYVRQPDGTWVRTTVTGLDAEFAFATVPVSIPMAEVYDNVTFPETPPR